MFDFLRNLTKSEAEKRQEMLTAYLDNALTPGERGDFEALLESDSALQASLEQQRQVKENISQLPRMRAPRNFTLDPAVYGRPTSQRVYTLYPVLRTATVVAAVLLVFLFSLEFVPDAQQTFETASEPMLASETANDADGVALEESAGDVAEQEAPAPVAGETGAEEAAEAVEDAAEDMPAEEAVEVVEEEAMMEAEAEGEAMVAPEEPAYPAASGDATANGNLPEATPSPTDLGTAEVGVTVAESVTITQGQEVTTGFNYAARTETAPEELATDFFSPTQPIPTAAVSNDGVAQLDRFDPSDLLKIGLGTLFVLLLAATVLLRRQL